MELWLSATPSKTKQIIAWPLRTNITNMFKKMLHILTWHKVCPSDSNKVEEYTICSYKKLISHLFRWKLPMELLPKLLQLQEVVCCPISPQSELVHYF